MAAIGGIFNTDGDHLNTETLVRISKAMSRRGGGGRSAVILDGCGLCWGCDARENAMSELSDVILLCDGEVCPEKDGVPAGYFGESDARMSAAVFGKYGIETHEYLWGEYAIAAYEKNKRELVLFRDRDGGRPLYYACGAGDVAFASEIKGLLAYLGEARVDRKIIVSHILSRYGQFSGGDIYSNISDVGAGGGVVMSRLGVSRFELRRKDLIEPKEKGDTSKYVRGEFVCPDEDGMKRMLCEILYAYDYPQFDCLMPSFLRDCERAREEGQGVMDCSLCFDIGYATERRDRLSTMVGYRPVCAPPSAYTFKERELKKMEQTLLSLLSETDKEKLGYIFDADITEKIMKIENTARRIRCLGMAIQSDIWYDGYRICFN